MPPTMGNPVDDFPPSSVTVLLLLLFDLYLCTPVRWFSLDILQTVLFGQFVLHWSLFIGS